MKVYTKSVEGTVIPVDIKAGTLNELIDRLQGHYSTQSTSFEGYTLTELIGGGIELVIRYASYAPGSYISYKTEYIINTEADE